MFLKLPKPHEKTYGYSNVKKTQLVTLLQGHLYVKQIIKPTAPEQHCNKTAINNAKQWRSVRILTPFSSCSEAMQLCVKHIKVTEH